MRTIPTFECRISPHYPLLPRAGPLYSSDMEDAESAKERLENHWRAKLEAARVQYLEAPYVETRTAYRSALKAFADLVLRHEAPANLTVAAPLTLSLSAPWPAEPLEAWGARFGANYDSWKNE